MKKILSFLAYSSIYLLIVFLSMFISENWNMAVWSNYLPYDFLFHLSVFFLSLLISKNFAKRLEFKYQMIKELVLLIVTYMVVLRVFQLVLYFISPEVLGIE